jgi:hypothetical protein
MCVRDCCRNEASGGDCAARDMCSKSIPKSRSSTKGKGGRTGGMRDMLGLHDFLLRRRGISGKRVNMGKEAEGGGEGRRKEGKE